MRLSVVIPMYNVEECIRRTLECLIPQLNQETEIVLVDDGSSDHTVHIAENIIQENSKCNIRLICQGINKGSSASRNRGIELSRGEYITFVDSDDTLRNDYIRTLLHMIEQNPACDIYVTGVETYNEDGELYEIQRNDNRTFDNRIDIIYAIIHNHIKLAFPTWCKVIRKAFLCENEIKFDEDAICMDDAIFYSKCYLKIDKICICDYVGYQWRRRKGSISSKYYINTPEIVGRYRNNCYRMFELLPDTLRDDRANQWMMDKSRFCFEYAIDHLEKSNLSIRDKKTQLLNIVEHNLSRDVIDSYLGYKRVLLKLYKENKWYGYYVILKFFDLCNTLIMRIHGAIERRINALLC